MSGRIRGISGHWRTPLASGWSMRATPAGSSSAPAQLRDLPADGWLPIERAATVADALRSAQRWSLDEPARRFDADDWWFRVSFDALRPQPDVRRDLAFDGLAGLAQVWLNGEPLLTSENMHIAHTSVEPPLHAGANELLLRFASLDQWLAPRRPRPRWRAPMVEHQQLRWTRNTLLGRTPGWSPPAAPVGPWREVALVQRSLVDVKRLRLASEVDGATGVVSIEIELAAIGHIDAIVDACLEIERDGEVHRAPLAKDAGSATPYRGTATVGEVRLWWPHTHGEPALYEARVVVRVSGRATPVVIDLGAIGFRTLSLATEGGEFSLRVNGEAIFCRGACWTPLDVVSLRSTSAACRAALEQVRDAGMNMLRVSGSMVYEEEHFHDACDALGIMVWQDFMFANMDYPADDPAFAATVRAEVEQQLLRWQCRPSLAVLCGNSEAEQQAAMWGSPRDTWAQPMFTRELAELAQALCPGVPYWPSSAHGGAFPHQTNAGTTSYYGVGAYLRPIEDARRSELRFATECLAFANVPPDATFDRMPGGAGLRAHHPGWKARSPRDLGAGWDFDDVRDHYLQRLYGVDPLALRSGDPARYLAMSRAVGAEVMGAAFGEWRRKSSSCGGALVWFLRDLWPGAGWGLLDDRGAPKAAFHGLRRALAPVSMFISDEGTNGLTLHVSNEPDRALTATIEVALYRDDGLAMQRPCLAVQLEARASLELPLAQWFDGFIDLSRAYRFGAAEHALVVATLRDASNQTQAQAFHFPEGLPSRRERDIGLSAAAHLHVDGSAEVILRAHCFAQSVYFDVPGFRPQDEYFHLAPGSQRSLRLVPQAPDARPALHGHVHALNAWSATAIEVDA